VWKASKIEESEIGDVRNPRLYGQIMRWRNKTAEEKGLPHYMILHLKTIVTLSNYAPSTLKEMKRVKGIGKATIENYGDELMEIILESGAINTLKEEEIKLKSKTTEKTKTKEKKKPTAEISFELFKSGKSVEEIAGIRGFTVRTIESHLADMVFQGKIDIHKLVEKEKFSRMEEYFKNADDDKLSIAKEALGEDFSYSELKYVQMYFRKLSGS
jgi:ribonuclease D